MRIADLSEGELEDAHSAEADVQAAVEVLRGMRRTFNLEETSWEELAKMTNPDKELWIGPLISSYGRLEKLYLALGNIMAAPFLRSLQEMLDT